jgi:hypothetical protein
MFDIFFRIMSSVRDKFFRRTEQEETAAYFKAARELVKARKVYETHRQESLKRHPRLRFLVPPALRKDQAAIDAEAAAKIAAEGTEEEKRQFWRQL